MAQLDQEVLKHLASKYVWWKTPDEAMAMPERVVAQVLTHAEIGQFNVRAEFSA